MLSLLNHPILQRLRHGQPWQEDLPFFAALFYGWGLVGNQPSKATLSNMLMVAVAAAGILALTYLLKTLVKSPDQPPVKLPKGAMPLLAVLGLAMAALPWWNFFPHGWSTVGLLASEILLIGIYYLPPFRLHQRGIWGMLCHAAFAQAIPAVLISLLLFYLGNRIYPHAWLLIPLIGAWRYAVGLRRQITQQPALDNNALLKPILLTLEILFLLGVAGLVAWEMPLFLVFFLFYPLQLLYKLRFVEGEGFAKVMLGQSADAFYAHWLPLIVLFGLVGESWEYALLAVIHLLLFPNAVVALIREYRSWLPRQRVKYSVMLLFFLMSGQMVQLLVTQQEYFPAFVLPMFANAPEGEASQVTMEIQLLGGNQANPLTMAEFLPQLTDSKRTIFLQRNMGPATNDQNHHADFRDWLHSHAQTIRPGTPWQGLEVKWFRVGTLKTALGTYRIDWPPEPQGHG